MKATDSGGSSNEDGSPCSQESTIKVKAFESGHAKPGFENDSKLQVPSHSQSCDTLTSEQSFPTSPLSSATSSATLVGSDSKSGSPRPSPVRKSPPQKLPTSNEFGTSIIDNYVIPEENEESIPSKPRAYSSGSGLQEQLSEETPPPTPPLPETPKHQNAPTSTGSGAPIQTPPISSVGSCFVLPPKAPVQAGQKSESRSSSISHPAGASGRLSTSSTTLTMNYLRVRGAGSKRGSGSSESESVGSTSVTPRSSFQTDTTGISTPRSSFQHPESPQMSSKAGVVVTSSRATSRRSSTASAASGISIFITLLLTFDLFMTHSGNCLPTSLVRSQQFNNILLLFLLAFAVATAASSNPPEPMDPMMKQMLPTTRNNSRFSSAAGADLKIPNMSGNANQQGVSDRNSAAHAAANAARCKRESMISTAATMRVLNVLRHWISKHSQDFENDAKLLQITTEFLDELVHNTNLLPAELKAAVQLQQMIAKQTMEAKEKIDLDVLLAPPIIPSKDTIESLSALEIAEVMTYIDHNIFIRIQSEEFLGQAWMKEDKVGPKGIFCLFLIELLFCSIKFN